MGFLITLITHGSPGLMTLFNVFITWSGSLLSGFVLSHRGTMLPRKINSLTERKVYVSCLSGVNVRVF